MPKTIVINDAKVLEFFIGKDEKGEFMAQIVYSLMDDKSNAMMPVRATLKDLKLTIPQKEAIQKVWDLMLNTIKNIEKI